MTAAETYQQLLTALQADPVFAEKTFPADFEQAVADQYSDYQAGIPGRYNDAAIYKNADIPGAFMAVADAWQSAIGYGADTHNQLWTIFSQWKNQVAQDILIPPQTGIMDWIKANPLIAAGILAAAIFFLSRKRNS